MPVALVPATAADRKLIARIRPPSGMGRFVHFNWFWLDRALQDPAIQFAFIRGGVRGGITGCLAYGPHEAVDLEPRSRMAGVGEIYHIVIGQSHAGRGLGAMAVRAAMAALVEADSNIKAVRLSHHIDNVAAAHLYARLGFTVIGEKIDGETGIRDRLLELVLPAPASLHSDV